MEKESITVDGVEYVKKQSNATSLDGLKACIIRAHSAGVFYGYVKEMEHTLAGTLVTVLNCRRLWKWAGAASLSQLAVEGSNNPGECKFTVFVQEQKIQNCIEIIPLTEEALNNLNNVPVWKN